MNNKTYLVSGLIVVALLVGIMIGYWNNPVYRTTMFETNTMDLGPADRWLDVRYINKMIAHHRGAMLLAEQAQKYSQRTEIQNLAKMIIENEPKAIQELYDWKKSWFNDTRTVNDPARINLGTANKNFDLRFLNALISHHQNGILMTEEVRLKSSRNEILDNADAVEDFLKTTLIQFQSWRTEWYNIK